MLPKDQCVNDAVMQTIAGGEMEMDSRSRYQLYRTRCQTTAAAINHAAISGKNLILLISSNGHLTKTAKVLVSALL